MSLLVAELSIGDNALALEHGKTAILIASAAAAILAGTVLTARKRQATTPETTGRSGP
ncbi:hypothetical protein L5G32_18480 [Gordonia sp. HY002]|nr:hypothetical protein [Gordonia zhenghanii]MCF8607575.1 hypothetical protein [Gordonia zhenghanii]